MILVWAQNRCHWLQTDSSWGWHQRLKRGDQSDFLENIYGHYHFKRYIYLQNIFLWLMWSNTWYRWAKCRCQWCATDDNRPTEHVEMERCPLEIHNRMFFPIVKIIDNRSNNQFYCNRYESTSPCLAQYALHCLILPTRRVPFPRHLYFLPKHILPWCCNNGRDWLLGIL